MDWSVGAGYSGLYAETNKRESAKQDLATLSVLNQEMKADKVEQEQAQLKEQAYYDQISKFADTLLAPDRARLNEKAKSMSGMIRNHLKQYGGDMTKFFENGGHRMLGDYKSSIINSEESSTMLDNKKNMERILDMQSKGFGHLINPTDMFNLKSYQETGQGKITSTGMLTEVKMPDPNSEIWGKEIDAKTILYNEGNYTKFKANYLLSFPDAGEPSEADLLGFVASQHSDILGKNYQKPMQERKMARDEFESDRTYGRGNFEKDREYDYREYRDDVGDGQWDKTHEMALRKERMEQEVALINAYAKEGGAKKSENSPTGYVNGLGEPVTKEDAGAINNFQYSMDAAIQQMNNEVTSIDGITSTATDVYKSLFGDGVLQDNTDGYREDGSGGTGSTTIGMILGGMNNGKANSIRELENSYHRIRASKSIMNGQVATTALLKTGVLPMDDKGEIKNFDLSQNRDVFGADGVRVSDYASDARLNPDGSTNLLSGENFASEVAKTTFKVKGMSTGFIGKDKAGNDIMITDKVTRGSSGKFTAKDKASKEWAERNYDQKGGVRHGMFITMQNEKGQVFHKLMDSNLEKSMLGQFAAMNIGLVKNSKAQASRVADGNTAKTKQAGEIYKSLRNDPESMAKIRQQTVVATNSPNVAKFDGAAISFYTHLKKQYEQSGNNVSIDALIKEGSFYKMVQSATDTPEEREKLNKISRDPSSGEYSIINFLIENTDYDGGADWKETLKYIQSIKYNK